MLRVLFAAARAQAQETRHNVEDLLPVLTMPLFTFAFMAILDFTGRRDLSGYAVVAPLLLTIGQMGVFVASEMIVRERSLETLQLIVASPAPFPFIVFARVLTLSALALVGFLQSWLIVRFVFDASVTIHHPLLLIATLLLTVLAATAAALIASAIFCFSRSPRTFQNSVTFPLFVISGVLVPVSYLPDWLEPLSRASFLYWSAELLRASLEPAAPASWPGQVLGLVAVGLVTAVIGIALVDRMISHLKKEGTLGL